MLLLVQHTMQALPLTSMSGNAFPPAVTSVLIRDLWRATLLVLCLLTGTTLGVAQQSPAIQPCEDTPPQIKSRRPALTTPSVTKTAAGQTLVDESIPVDPLLEQLIAPYAGKVRGLSVVVGKLEGDLRKALIGAGSLGNFVTDGLRAMASRKLGESVPVMVTNSGGLRKNIIAEGDLRASDIFELMPFENALMQLEMTGEQLHRLLTVVLVDRDAQSGAKIRFRMNAENRPEMVSVKLRRADGGEVDINPRATYRIVTIDYLLSLASGPYAILQEGKNIKPIGVTMRDAMMEYVKGETADGRALRATLDGRFEQVDAPKNEVRPQ